MVCKKSNSSKDGILPLLIHGYANHLFQDISKNTQPGTAAIRLFYFSNHLRSIESPKAHFRIPRCFSKIANFMSYRLGCFRENWRKFCFRNLEFFLDF
ncbi:hypothetical protein T12_16551 [Trichinella patagoniensis]|uniref:Uncharacterized protein n=1 Tax=Trichinella patagoniensis TaxID=990121 RepID=A0A0V0ZWE8_9BILA|nr:hypothetical protein T12_16551 [Trichinella patagoniensis]